MAENSFAKQAEGRWKQGGSHECLLQLLRDRYSDLLLLRGPKKAFKI
jgi:hypothetical protein